MQEMDGKRIGYDLNDPLITMYRCLQKGWIPQQTMEPTEYKTLKTVQDPADPRTAFAGIGCSFAGKWFGGFIGNGEGAAKCSVGASARGLLKQLPKIQDVKFRHSDYREISLPANSLIYCDPPYEGTTQYPSVPKFDHSEFWNQVKEWTLTGHSVVVSEYYAPKEFTCVMEIPRSMCMRNSNGAQERVVEKLFMYL